jgi:hypothetical protein
LRGSLSVAHLGSNDRRMRTQALAFRSNRLPQKVAPRSAGAKSISPALKLIVFALFLPLELSFYLTLLRLILFLLTPVLLVHFIQLLASGRRHLVFSDILIVLTGAWMIVSPAVVVDLEYSLHHGVLPVVEFCGSYLAGRILLSERGQALSFVNLLCHVIAIVAFLGVLDILVGRSIIHDFLGPLTGYRQLGDQEEATSFRNGLFRAMGPMDHPIIFGSVCAFGFLLAVASPIRAKGLTIAASGLGVLSSLSSGPIQGVIFGLGLVAYDSILPRFRGRWLLPIGIGALGIGAFYAFGASPALVFCHLGLDCASYWIRLFEWNTVVPFVLNSPWVGIAFQWQEIVRGLPYFALASIDSLWLYLALVYGIPGAVLVALSMVSATCYPASGRGVNLTMAESKIAVTLGILIAVIVLLGFTVDFWGESWMLIGLLVGVRAHLADPGSQRAPSGSVFVRKSADGHHHRPLGGKRAADDSLLSRSPYAGAKDQP